MPDPPSTPPPGAAAWPPAYPDAPRLDVVDVLHGRRVADPYRWLEDPASDATTAWSAAQDALCRAYLDRLPGREHLAARLRALLTAGSVGPPRWRGGRGFWTRRGPDDQHAVLYVGAGPDDCRPLLDPTVIDPSGLTTLDAWDPSPDGCLLAYQLSTGGDEESTLRVLDVGTGEVVDGPLDRTRYSPVAWEPDGESFFYVRRPTLDSPYDRRVWRHRLGTGSDGDTDEYVWGEGRDPRTYYGVDVSLDGRWLVVTASVGTEPRDDAWIADLSASRAPQLTTVQEGVDARCAPHVAHDGRLYVWTDRDAPRGRLCVADPVRPADWVELVPEDPDAVLGGYAVLADEVVVTRARHALAEVAVVDRVSGRHRRDVALPGLGSLTGVTARPEGGTEAWLGYTDHVTPPQVVTLAGATWATAPGGPDVPDVHARQESYPSKDGTTVRLTVLAPTAEPDRPRPTVLYGYGGFGVSLEPAYTVSALAWVEAGGVWAVAHLRGGSEEGEAWHRAGMREHKQNVFDDFHAAAEHLRGTGRASRVGAYGGSNGGLLVGAALTQRPDLYDAVVCSAPLLDMVRYERFGLGATWNDEYGTADDPVEIGWLLAYSPYHRAVEAGAGAAGTGPAYPATLFEVFESDTRVDPLHARKMAAALQHAQSRAAAAGEPILVRRETEVGHGARSVDRTVALGVDTLAFLADRL